MANWITWVKAVGELARQQEFSTLASRQAEIVVSPGTAALLWRDGVLLKTLQPGRYPLASSFGSSWWGNVNAAVAVSWVDTAAITQIFVFPNIRSSDNVSVQVTLQIVCQIHNSALFAMSMLHAREVCMEHDLKARLFDELRNGVADWVAMQTIHTLSASRGQKDELEQSLRRHLYHSWERMGIALQRVDAASFHNPDIEALRDFSSLSSLQSVQKNIEFSLTQQAMQREHALAHLQLKQQQQLAEAKQLFAHQVSAADQQHELALAGNKLSAQLQQQVQQVETQEKIKDRQLFGKMDRQKYQVTAEAEISTVAMETQKKRAVTAIEIAEQQAGLDFHKAQLQIRLEQMRRELHSTPKKV